ncbi:MAG: hypothetical protein WCJ59_00095, partial [bacterium]
MYQPGETLEPGCPPTDPGCGVLTFSLNGQSTTSQSIVTGSSGTDFNISSSDGIHTLNIPTASATNKGLLSSIDWLAFNYKLDNTLNTGKIFIGDGSNSASPVTVSGDGSLSSAGVFSLSNNTVVTSKILDNNITYAKLQNVGGQKILGNSTNSSSNTEEISIGSGLTFSGTDLKLDVPTCSSAQRLSWNGSTFECKGGGVFSEIVAANKFLLGPTDGDSSNPTFRSIVAADLGIGTSTNQDVLLGNLSWFQLLDGSGKINSSILPSSITGSLKFKGAWNANTNNPTLISGGAGGVSGDFYVVDVAGTSVIDGHSVWNVGDWIINASSTWDRVEQGATVSSVNGATGNVLLTTDDINQGLSNKYFTDTLARGAFTGIGPISLSTTTGNIDCPTCVLNSGNGNLVAGTGVDFSGSLSNRLIGGGNVTFALNNTSVSSGSYGSSVFVPSFTVDAQGRLTSAGTTTLDTSVLSSGNLAVARGGTGVGSFNTNGILYGNGTGTLSASSAGTSGQFLVANDSGIPTFVSASGDLTLAPSGLITINSGAINSVKILDNTIVNADISASAGISYSKLNLSGSILNGDIATGTIANNRLTNSTVRLTLSNSGNDISFSTSSVALGGSLVVNVPDASITARGVVSTSTQTFIGDKTFVGTSTFSGNVKTTGNFSMNDSIDYPITGIQNNVDLGKGQFFRYTGNNPATFTGIAGGEDGRIITILTKEGGGTLTLTNEDPSSNIVNDIVTGTEGSIDIPEDNAVMLQYEAAEHHWHVISPPSSATSLLAKESFLNGGSAFGSVASIGTTDAFGLNLITSGVNRFNLATSSATLTGNGATALSGGTTLALSSGYGSDLNITSGTTGNLNLDSGSTGTINIGTNANGKIINLGNTTPGTTLNLFADGGGINLNGDVSITGGHSFTTGSGLIIDNSNALSLSATNTVIDMTGAGTLSLNTTTNRPITTGNGLFTMNGGLSVSQNFSTPKGIDYSTTGTQNDVDLGTGSLIRYTGNGDAIITGLTGGVDGRQIHLMNSSAYSLTINNQDSGSVAANRFINPTGSSIIVKPNTTAMIQYDAGASRWRILAVTLSGFSLTQGGNALGSTAVVGTTDANGLNFVTSGSTRFGIASNSSTLTGIGSTVINGGSTLTLSSASTSDLNIISGTTGNLNLDSGSNGSINLGTNSNAKNIAIGNAVGNTSVNIYAGTGGVNFNGPVNLGNASSANISISNQVSVGGMSSITNGIVNTNGKYQIAGLDVLNSNTLGSGIVNSSLTSLGTLGSLNVSGAATLATTSINSLSLGNNLTSTFLAVDSTGKIVGTTTSQFLTSSLASSTYLSIANASSTYYLASNPASYITATALTPYLSTTSAANNYVSTSTAALTYLSIANASSTYYLASNPTGYITATALTPYLSTTSAASNYVSTSSLTANLANYLTAANASSTYYLASNPASYITATALTPYLSTTSAANNYVSTSTAALTYL